MLHRSQKLSTTLKKEINENIVSVCVFFVFQIPKLFSQYRKRCPTPSRSCACSRACNVADPPSCLLRPAVVALLLTMMTLESIAAVRALVLVLLALPADPSRPNHPSLRSTANATARPLPLHPSPSPTASRPRLGTHPTKA